MGDWSSVMIPALAAGGRGFDSPITAFFVLTQVMTQIKRISIILLFSMFYSSWLRELTSIQQTQVSNPATVCFFIQQHNDDKSMCPFLGIYVRVQCNECIIIIY